MNCMKCGREIPLGQVFCKECLTDMSDYPVKPGTPVPIFTQPAAAQPKRTPPARKAKKPEEQIAELKKWITGLGVALLVVILGFTITTAILAHELTEAQNAIIPGQNYSTSDTVK